MLSAISVWCSLFFYSSRGFQDVEATEKHRQFWAARSNDEFRHERISYVIYGWPNEEGREKVLERDAVLPSQLQKYSLSSYGAIRNIGRQKAFNYAIWLVIAIFTFTHAYQITSSSNFPSCKFGMTSMLKLFLLLAIIFRLANGRFGDWSSLLLVPISVGIYCCIAETFRAIVFLNTIKVPGTNGTAA